MDLCYGNIKDAYISKSQPPLGFSDHNVVFLLPHYRAELKRQKTYSAHQWLEDNIVQLQGSLACTEWDTLSGGTLNEKVKVITDYIKFCISTTIPVKHIKKYPNSKPWITLHIIHSPREKQKAFQQKDWVSLKIKTREIRTEIFKAQLRYKEKLEQHSAQ